MGKKPTRFIEVLTWMFAWRVPSTLPTSTSYAATFRMVGSAMSPRLDSSDTTWCTPAMPTKAEGGTGVYLRNCWIRCEGLGTASPPRKRSRVDMSLRRRTGGQGWGAPCEASERAACSGPSFCASFSLLAGRAQIPTSNGDRLLIPFASVKWGQRCYER